jgi:hypothetical protein
MVWFVINGVSAAAPIALVPLVRPDLRRDLIAGAVVSGASAGVTFFWPLKVETYGAWLAGRAPTSTCRDALDVERLARAAAIDEDQRIQWPWHAANAAVSGALGALMAFGFDHKTTGLVTGISSFLAGEAQLLSQPTHLRDEWSAYVSSGGIGAASAFESATRLEWTVRW